MSVFRYLCAACQRPARQHITTVQVTNDAGKVIGSARSLGSWRCGCTPRGVKTKVKRERVG